MSLQHLSQGLKVIQPLSATKGASSRRLTTRRPPSPRAIGQVQPREGSLRRAVVLSSSSTESAESPESSSVPIASKSEGSLGPGPEELLNELFRTIAGLDRGAASDQASRMKVDDLVAQLEKAQKQEFYELSLFSGRWRLVYTSGFVSGSLGGERPGPAFGSPILLGQVYQVVDNMEMTLDNVVEARIPSVGPMAMVPNLTLPTVEISLGHKLEVENRNAKITFEKSKLRLLGGPDVPLPEFDIPSLPDFLQPPSDTRSASFENIYMDDKVRISQGDRGECRIYVRVM